MRDWKKYPPRRVASSTRAARRLAKRLKIQVEAERADMTTRANRLFRELQHKIMQHKKVTMGSFWVRVRRVFQPGFGL